MSARERCTTAARSLSLKPNCGHQGPGSRRYHKLKQHRVQLASTVPVPAKSPGRPVEVLRILNRRMALFRHRLRLRFQPRCRSNTRCPCGYRWVPQPVIRRHLWLLGFPPLPSQRLRRVGEIAGAAPPCSARFPDEVGIGMLPPEARRGPAGFGIKFYDRYNNGTYGETDVSARIERGAYIYAVEEGLIPPPTP